MGLSNLMVVRNFEFSIVLTALIIIIKNKFFHFFRRDFFGLLFEKQRNYFPRLYMKGEFLL